MTIEVTPVKMLTLVLAAAGLLTACSSSGASGPPKAPGLPFRAYVDTGDAIQRLSGSPVTAAKLPPGLLSPDGGRLVATYGPIVRSFDPLTGAMTGEIRLGQLHGQVDGFSPAGGFVVVGGGSQNATWFAVVSSQLTGPVRTATLDGSFSFDALSDDGGSLFLIENLGGQDYRVRRYDLLRDRLDPTILVEKGALPTALMNGQRYASVAVPALSTVYSLYYGNSGAFVHALSLSGGPISCIDLPGPRAIDPERQSEWALALSPDRTALYAVNAAEGVVSQIALSTGHVRSGTFSPPAAPAAWMPVTRAAAKELDAGGSAAVSPDGKTLYASALHGYVAIDTSTLALKGAYVTSSRIQSLSTTPDGRWLLAVRDQDRLVRILAATGGLDAVLLASNGPMTLIRIERAAR